MASERDKTHQDEDSKSLPNLPQEIVVEILYRLPVRSLLRFRCVCKTWSSLISDPQFVKTHLNISSKDDNFAQCSSKIILHSDGPPYDLKSCSLYYAFYEPSFVNTAELDYPQKHPDNSTWIVGCCNGLICISVADIIFIWNPATRKSKRLPVIESIDFLQLYGFGYDEFTDDYKLFIVYYDDDWVWNERETKVYACRTGSWRRIPDFPCGIPTDKSGIFVNQALHWEVPCKYPSSNKRLICSMDLARETYGEVLPPNYGDGDYFLTLGVLGGCLCVLCEFRGIRADVWVMKEYGVRDSWSKLVCVPHVHRWLNVYSPPLYISKNGEILLKDRERLVIYNPECVRFRYLMIHNVEDCRQADTYIESLVSPSAGCVDERQVQ